MVDKRRVGDNVTWRDVVLHSHATVDVLGSKLEYSGARTIFVTHVYRTRGQ